MAQPQDVAEVAVADAKEKSHDSSSEVAFDGFDDDQVHAGLTFPTEEEKETLRRVIDHLPWNAFRTSPRSAPPTRSWTENVTQ
jgi:hypothetical protein